MRVPKTIGVILLCSLFHFPLSAEPWLGASHSPKWIGVSSLMNTSDGRSYLSAELVADLSGVLRGWRDVPGVQFRFSRLYPLTGTTLSTGTSMQLLAGPGVMAGYICDRDGDHGVTAGLSGTCGLFFDFRKQVAAGLFLSTDIGLHHQLQGTGNVLRFYMDGVLRAYYPEFRLLYRF